MIDLGVLQVIFDNLEINLRVILSNEYAVNIALICNSYKGNGESLSKYIREKLKISSKEKELIRFLHDNGKRIPDNTNISEMRRFRASVSENNANSLFKYLRGIGVSTNDVESAIDSLPPLRVGRNPLVNGEILIDKTGLEPEMRLGRLKGWLHRKQIEMDLDNIEQVLELLDDIDWENSNPAEWPYLSWP
jgi:hypothetical protein